MINNKECILVQGGIGAASTTMLITLLSTLCQIEYVVNVGTAGGVANKGLNVGDVVVSNQLAYYDADVTAFGYKFGQMAQCPRAFKADDELISVLLEQNPNIKVGDMLSGDKFITDKHQPNRYIQENFSDLNVLAFDMESCAIAHVCYLTKTKVLVIRSISDLIGSSDAFDYGTFAPIAAKNATDLVNFIIKEL
jgi:adenosylhomocysteine nucleosidase